MLREDQQLLTDQQLRDASDEQLQAERQAHAEVRRLLAGALDRVPPQLEAPRESSEASESVVEKERAQASVQYRRPSGGR